MPPLVCITSNLRRALAQASGVSVGFVAELAGVVEGNDRFINSGYILTDTSGNLILSFANLIAKITPELDDVIYAYSIDPASYDHFCQPCLGPSGEVYFAIDLMSSNKLLMNIGRIEPDGTLAWYTSYTGGTNASYALVAVKPYALFYANSVLNMVYYEERWVTQSTRGSVVATRSFDATTGAKLTFFAFEPGSYVKTDSSFRSVFSYYINRVTPSIVVSDQTRTIQRCFAPSTSGLMQYSGHSMVWIARTISDFSECRRGVGSWRNNYERRLDTCSICALLRCHQTIR